MRKKIVCKIVCLLLFTLVPIALQAQKKIPTDETIKPEFCSYKNKDTVKYDDLLKCIELTTSVPGLKIISFSVSAITNDAFILEDNIGNVFKDGVLNLIKNAKAKKVNRLIIDKIKVVEEGTKNVKYIDRLVLYLNNKS